MGKKIWRLGREDLGTTRKLARKRDKGGGSSREDLRHGKGAKKLDGKINRRDYY